MSCWEQYRELHWQRPDLFLTCRGMGARLCTAGRRQKKPQKPKAEFRVMAQCSLDFHVLSTLWMLEVGHLFDAKLTACAYGNRLRRTQDGKHQPNFRSGPFTLPQALPRLARQGHSKPCARRWTPTRRSWRSRPMSVRSITS
jgi:hypothetical protein